MNESVSSTPVTQELDARGIAYRLFTHPGPVHTLEQAAWERGQRPEQVVRSLLFRLADSEFVMVLVAGPQQVSWSALRSHLGVTRMTTATTDEVLLHTGYEVGAVSPFGLPATIASRQQPIRILADESIFSETEVSIGSGVRYTTVILKSADLRNALGAVETGQYIAGKKDK
jgi:prolyl-tRNA editing enzyme YbaK/EbsC (Cys-tRNA(Pro) deacylase)